MANGDSPHRQARNHNRGGGNMTRGLAACLRSCHPQTHLCHSCSSDPGFLSNLTATGCRYSEGGEDSLCQKRWAAVTSDLCATIIPVFMNYFRGGDRCGGGCSLRANKTGLWPKGSHTSCNRHRGPDRHGQPMEPGSLHYTAAVVLTWVVNLGNPHPAGTAVNKRTW